MELCISQKCTGCMSCFSACNKGAINIKDDEEGFSVPIIKAEKCINCKKCTYVCPILNPFKKEKNIIQKGYAAWSSNKEIRKSSSSGGIFFELARVIINEGGVVCGASFLINLE